MSENFGSMAVRHPHPRQKNPGYAPDTGHVTALPV